MKHCPRCNQDRDESEYNVKSRNKDGLSQYCKTCTREQARASYERHGSEYREKMSRRYYAKRGITMVNTVKDCKCPICNQDFTNIKAAELVCVQHQSWLVTKCIACGAVGFSDCAGFCMVHAGGGPMPIGAGYNKDHRAALRAYGLEGWS